MAITALKVPTLGDQAVGGSILRGTIAGPASYATGGFTADIATDFGISESDIDYVVNTSDSGYTGAFDAGNDKILSYTSGGTETTATTDLQMVTFQVTVFLKNTLS